MSSNIGKHRLPMCRGSLQMGTDLYQHRYRCWPRGGNIGTDIGTAPTDMGNPCCQGRGYTSFGTDVCPTSVNIGYRCRRGAGADIGTDIGIAPTDIGNRCSQHPQRQLDCPRYRYRCRYRPKLHGYPMLVKTPKVPMAVRHIGTDIGMGPTDMGYRCQ